MSKNEQKAAKKGKREQKGAYPEKTSKAVLTKRLPDKTSEPVQLKKMSHKTVMTKRLLNCQGPNDFLHCTQASCYVVGYHVLRGVRKS